MKERHLTRAQWERLKQHRKTTRAVLWAVGIGFFVFWVLPTLFGLAYLAWIWFHVLNRVQF